LKNELTDEQINVVTVEQWGPLAYPLVAHRTYARAIIAAHEAQQVGQEPTVIQYRMAPTWEDRDNRWTKWEDCTAAQAADYERVKVVNDWEYQVRRLYTAPQAMPVSLTAEQIDQSAKKHFTPEYMERGLHAASLDWYRQAWRDCEAVNGIGEVKS
jgi:hypothetical protein